LRLRETLASMNNINIRPAQCDDTSAIAKLLEQLARRYITPEFDSAAQERFLTSNNEAAINGFILAGFRYWVAEQNGVLIGFAGVRDHTHLYHLFVAEDAQRRGVARRLWNAALNACLVAGNPGRFTVNSSNNAVAVYESFGFVRSGPQQNANGVLFNPMELDMLANKRGQPRCEDARG